MRRYARALVGGVPVAGLVEGGRFLPLPPREVPEAMGGPAREGTWSLEALPLAAVRLLPPVVPVKVVGVGLNYHTHAAELGMAVPEEPLLFLKPPTAVVGPGDPIVLPRESERVDYEGEVAVVVGRRLRRASPEEAEEAVFGFTCANDVTARDLQRRESQWTRAKGFDTFAPLGPWVAAGIDASSLRVATYVNDARRQWDSTANLVFRPAELLSYISQFTTLLPGDVVLTGTPAGIGALRPGDVVEVEVEGVGRLRNPVVSESGE